MGQGSGACTLGSRAAGRVGTCRASPQSRKILHPAASKSSALAAGRKFGGRDFAPAADGRRRALVWLAPEAWGGARRGARLPGALRRRKTPSDRTPDPTGRAGPGAGRGGSRSGIGSVTLLGSLEQLLEQANISGIRLHHGCGAQVSAEAAAQSGTRGSSRQHGSRCRSRRSEGAVAQSGVPVRGGSYYLLSRKKISSVSALRP